MYTVGRIGSYISRGVYTVSAPFHPFGGAVDIIVVEQPDGSFKSSPWYVRFGKFQGVLKTKEKVVTINVNGVDANFNMYLDHKGEAYFLKEADIVEGESASYPWSSGDEVDVESSSSRRLLKSQSCDYDADNPDSAGHLDARFRKTLPRTYSQRARVLGFVLGRKSFKERDGDINMTRLSSLESAEIAADLLEVKWSTNLQSSKGRKEDVSQNSAHDVLDNNVAEDIQVDNEETHVNLSVHDHEQKSNDQSVLDKESGSHREQIASISHFSSENLESSVEEAGTDTSCLGTVKQVVQSSPLDESSLEKSSSMVSELSTRIDDSAVWNTYPDEHEQRTFPHSKTQNELDVRHEKYFDEEQAFDKIGVALSGCRISTEVGSDRVQSFIYCEKSETSLVGSDATNGKTQEELYLASGGCSEVHVHLETIHATTELLPKDTDVEQSDDIELEKEPGEVSVNHSDQVNQAPCVPAYVETDLKEPQESPESSTQVVSAEIVVSSIKEVNSQNSCLTPTEVREEKGITDDLHQYLGSISDSQELYSDGVLKRDVGNSPSESSEEEQFLFSDLDEFELSKVRGLDSGSPDRVKRSDHPAVSAEGIKEVSGSLNTNNESSSSSDMFGQFNQLNDSENSTETLRAMSNPIIIHKSHIAAEGVGRLAESLPIMRSVTFKLDAHDTHHPLSHSLDSNFKSLKWILYKENDSSRVKSDTDIEPQLAEEQPNIEGTCISQEQKSVLSDSAAGNPARTTVSPGGSWRIWPFFRRSSSGKAMQPVISDSKSSDAEFVSDSIEDRDGTRSVCQPKVMKKKKKKKKKIRVLTPTSEQLASLNLKEGKNSVTFTFSTAMLGKQQVDAKIYLWKWNTRIVISDVDGTITKSDVLGQFMPLVGIDWSQTGVAHLFSAIKENGYQLLFLSARAIVQAYHTRRFLFNLKQDGKALPDGPVVISPDGLFPSLFREVIRRAPHEFKIACLEDIKALFPSECNPFYAGFGNRDTDEISYLKVGIPRGKIFIINPKGEVAVNRRVDCKTYTSLHALVHGMFPQTMSTEQEDFNQWNYWKLPPPDIDV